MYQNNQLTITSEGIYLYHQIKKIQSEINKIESFLIDEISLQIGTSKTIGEFIISDTLSKFNQQFDNPKVSVLVDNTSALLSLLTKRKIDFALISGPISISDFDCEVFLEDNILLVCSNQHPLANRTVSINKLSTERFLIRESGSGIMEAVLNKFNEHKMDYQDLINKQVVGNINVIKDMVYKNEGISFIYQSSVKKELENKKISTITIKGFNQKQPFYIVKNQQQILNNSSYSFLKLLKNKKEC
ncbi:LysR substrate-binding domain-containing protein [Vagococcus fluvialis]|uniref:LysR substrate-binding domain-containing protein n=1 Tax=Vagococcus fluvialis TaxID=2738 RepID=UPI003B5C536B